MCKQLKELIKRGFAPLNEKSKSPSMEEISNNSVSQSLIGMLKADFSVSDDEAENIVGNYIYLTQLVKQDLLEIEANLTMLKDREKNTPAEDTYLHKKIRHFYALNQKAKDDVIDFLTNKLIPFIADAKTYRYLDREQDQLTMLFLNGRYDYASFRHYYNIDYDFATEAKIRFIPGINLENMQETIEEYVSLHGSNPEEYDNRIDKIVSQNNCIQFIAEKVSGTYHLFHRKELFNTLVSLYNAGEYQSYIALAVIQLEGIFYDCCTILNQREAKQNFGTLIEKVDKVFSQNRVTKQALYPHYAFTIPNLRNEIAHKGFSAESNLYHQANELTLDLYTVVYWCCKLEQDKFYTIFQAYEESVEAGISSNRYDRQVLTTLFSCYQLFDREFIDVLADPSQYLSELDFYKSLAPSEDAITIKERVNTISGIIKRESFWKEISNELDSVTEHKPGKPYDFVDFIIHLRNAIIPVLSKDTPEKLACQEVSKKLKQFN